MRCLWLSLGLVVAVVLSSLVVAQPPQPPKGPPPPLPEFTMVLIPAGEFVMGSNEEQLLLAEALYPSDAYRKREVPAHKVYVDAFLMDNCEVTVKQFREFCEATKNPIPPQPEWQKALPDVDNHPVVNVTWAEASLYAKWAGKRLPTEAEWEKAARGGLEQKAFPWGDEKPDGSQANVEGNQDGYDYTSRVATFEPNAYALYDMCGNVWERCSDWYADDYYAKSPPKNPTGLTTGQWKVERGGAWSQYNPPRRTGCAYRSRGPGDRRQETIGFRCVKDVPPAQAQ